MEKLRRLGASVPGLLGALALAGCNSLGLGGEPEELAVEVEASGASQIVVITSSEFSFVQNAGCEQGQQCEPSLIVLEADTTTVGVPFRRTYAFTPTLKYLVEVFPAGGGPATVSMHVEVDGKDWFDSTRELLPVGENGEQETILFTYQFTEPTLR